MSRKGRKNKGNHGGGMVPFAPTEADRANVRRLSGLGIPHDQIAAIITNPRTGRGISKATLHVHFRDDLDAGAAETNIPVVANLLRIASGRTRGAVTAAIYWTKARCGWRDGRDGGDVQLDPAAFTAALRQALASMDHAMGRQEARRETVLSANGNGKANGHSPNGNGNGHHGNGNGRNGHT